MFFLSDLIETVLVASLMTTLFLGGWQVPYLHPDGFSFPWGGHIALSNLPVVLLGVLSFFIKVVFFIWFLMAVRWTFPRFRYDQLMNLGWKVLLPASLFNIASHGRHYCFFKVNLWKIQTNNAVRNWKSISRHEGLLLFCAWPR